jgi:hypothetical protein
VKGAKNPERGIELRGGEHFGDFDQLGSGIARVSLGSVTVPLYANQSGRFGHIDLIQTQRLR